MTNKYIFLILLCFSTIVICQNFQLNEKNVAIVKAVNPLWIDFYKSRISDFQLQNFKFFKREHEKAFSQGHIAADFDSAFDHCYAQFLIESPHGDGYIDLDSYKLLLENDKKGNLICKGEEIDQEINWVNRQSRQINRLKFCGSDEMIEDARWVDSSHVILFGRSDNKLTLEFIELNTGEHIIYTYSGKITDTVSYNRAVRLKSVRFSQ